MPTRAIKILSVLLFTLVSGATYALTQEQLTALQDYLTERAGGGKSGQPMRDAHQKLEEVERRLLPLIFVFKRTGPLVESRAQELEILQNALNTGELDFNPYEGTDWLKSKSRETVQVCCIIRNDQRLAQSIQENAARGFPPMTPQTLEQITAQIREANREGGGGLIIEDDPPSTSNPREIPAGRFKPSARSGSPSTPAQKMLDNIGYSDKPAPAPPPPPSPATPVPAPTGTAAPLPTTDTPTATPPTDAAPPVATPPPAPTP